MKPHSLFTKSKTVAVVFFLLSLALVFATPDGCAAVSTASTSRVDLQDVNVAIYIGIGSLGSSAIALEHLFAWMNATVDLIDGESIRNGTLSTCDILVFPGGSIVSYRDSLEPEGLDIVREFVSDGGSYFGICGGSMFATNAVLGLFDGTYSNSINGTDIFLTQMNVNHISLGPDLSSEPRSCQTMYWGSSYFYGNGMSTAIPIANYTLNNKPGMIAFTYGEGTAFLSSPHPEYEEGDSRDGTDFCDYLDDPDSEWSLLLKVSCWLVDASITENTESGNQLPDYFMLLTFGGAGLIGVIIIIFLAKSRLH